MYLFINQQNIIMKWAYVDLQKWINNGCDKNIAQNVIELNCSNNKLICQQKLVN
jgi:hypothetical protein